jgi:hypothetical protein
MASSSGAANAAKAIDNIRENEDVEHMVENIMGKPSGRCSQSDGLE